MNQSCDIAVKVENRPFVELVPVKLPAPSLGDNTADLDRLTRTLSQSGFSPVRLAPGRMDEVVRKIRALGLSFRTVLGYAATHWEILDVVEASGDRPLFGFAVDLGSTTLVLRLIDILRRKIVEETAVKNPQVKWGEDILSRILFARSREGLGELRACLIEACSKAMEKMMKDCGVAARSVHALCCAGNTAMSHFFWGLDPSNICREPYIPAANTFPTVHASELGFDFLPASLLYLFPNVGAYVGGDIVSGVVAADLNRSEQTRMLIDVGTNAEVVVGNRQWLLACAGAAGPALEGGVVERGMQAVSGAIDRVRIDRQTGEPDFGVVGSAKAAGICGSGLIELVAEMFSSKILTIQGKFTELPCSRFRDTPDGRAYALALSSQTVDGQEILVSEIDIGVFLKSKAAMYTILSVICRKVGLNFADLEKIYIAGAFGNHIDPEMAVRIGMIPDLPLDTYHGVGNSSLSGASMLLCDRTLLTEVETVRNMITYVELNVNVELINEFRGAQFIPHTDPRLFPSVQSP
ncbi:MAG: ASKHA domain-containing protein [Syntrophobacteraceae bacterium]|nr:ASKHA domain-containing protein [Syntrophobacteraceae bacterium]